MLNRMKSKNTEFPKPVIRMWIELNANFRQRFLSATSTAAVNQKRNRIVKQTVRNRLAEHGIQSRRLYRGPVRTRRHRGARLIWARRCLLEFSEGM